MNKMFDAIYGNDIKYIREHVNSKNVNTKFRNGDTPIIVATSCHYYEMVKLLIGKGADINQHSIKSKYTPLSNASSAGLIEIVKLLLEHNCNINAQEHGFTALSDTLWGYHKNVAKVLIEAGADPFLKSERTNASYIDGIKDPYFGYTKEDVQELMGVVEKYDTLYKKCIRYVKNNREKFSRQNIQYLVKDIRKNFDLNLFE